ncbi:hypothetical protein JCM3766R1_002541 [Sporobolomyces carnicolor]
MSSSSTSPLSDSTSTPPTDPSLPSETLPSDPAELTPDLEDDIDLSTLRFLSGTLRYTFLPYLGWIIAFTSLAKIARFASPYLFRATRWTATWGFWAFEKLVKFLAWASMWLGMFAAVVWLLGGVGLGVAWLAIKAKPTWRKALRERPVLTKFAARGILELALWKGAKKLLGSRIGMGILVLAVGWESVGFIQAATSRKTTVHPPPPPPPQHEEDETEDSESDDRAEQWARKVKEDMLRESLLRRGKTSGAGAERGAARDATSTADGDS